MACFSHQVPGDFYAVRLKSVLEGDHFTVLQYFLELEQWFSTFLVLQPLNTVPHVVVTHNHKIVFVATA